MSLYFKTFIHITAIMSSADHNAHCCHYSYNTLPLWCWVATGN